MYKGVLIEVVLPSFTYETGKQLAIPGKLFSPLVEAWMVEKKSNSVVFVAPLDTMTDGVNYFDNGGVKGILRERIERFVGDMFNNKVACKIICIDNSHFIVQLENSQLHTDVVASDHVHSLAAGMFSQK